MLSLQPLLTCVVGHVTINILPDDVLLYIFQLYYGLEDVDRLSWWHQMVHVCRRWRSVVFQSPKFLDLRLVCGPRTRVEFTGIWPLLPIIISNMADRPMPEDYDFGAAMTHPSCVYEISLLRLTSSQLQCLASAMQVQFPALIHLMLGYDPAQGAPPDPLPDRFLDGSVPCLQTLEFHSIPFPALPKLLLSATSLVHLNLWNIPHSGYFSPEAFVTSLAVLVNLKSLTIELASPPSFPGHSPPQPTRTSLPALNRLEFKGVSEYLEDLVARIDAPLLDSIWITLFFDIIFDIPQLALFMKRTKIFHDVKEAHVGFSRHDVHFESLPPTRTSDKKSRLRISCEPFNWQLLSLTQVFPSFSPYITMVEHLYIYGRRHLLSQQQGETEARQWVDFFRPFTSLKNLYLSNVVARRIAPALQEIAGDTLQNIFLEELKSSPGSIRECIGKFVDARQLPGGPVSVSLWEKY